MQVTLKSAANRVIEKAQPQLDPVETLMKSIRDRSGRTADNKPDRFVKKFQCFMILIGWGYLLISNFSG